MVVQQLKVMHEYPCSSSFVIRSYSNSDWKDPQEVSRSTSGQSSHLWGQIKLLRVLCILILKTLKYGDLTTSLHSPPHCLTIFRAKKKSTYIQMESVLFKILAFISYPLSMPVSSMTLLFAWLPHKYLKAAVRSTWRCLFSSFLSLSSEGKCPEFELTPVWRCLFYWEGPKLDTWLQSHDHWREMEISPMDHLAVALLV